PTTAPSRSWAWLRIPVGGAAGCSCWAGDAAAASRRIPLNRIVRWNRMLHLSVWNLDGAVPRRHQLSFDIPDPQPDRISARLDIETGADSQTSVQPVF